MENGWMAHGAIRIGTTWTEFSKRCTLSKAAPSSNGDSEAVE